MYLQLTKICFIFEKILEDEYNYFNVEDYHVYSIEERQELINAETYKTDDFILISQMERNEIVEKYLVKNRNYKLLLNRKDYNFYDKFHWYIEDNNLVNDWNSFERFELIKFAVVWCKKNKIRFTTKK